MPAVTTLGILMPNPTVICREYELREEIISINPWPALMDHKNIDLRVRHL